MLHCLNGGRLRREVAAVGTNTTYRDEVSRNILRGRDVLFHRDMKDKVVNEWEKMFHEVLSHTRYMYVKEEVHVRSVLL